MKRRLLFTALFALLLLTGFAFALNDFSASWWTVDGGGGTFSTGGAYTLGGTIGQPDAGLLTGGPYTLGGGFWAGGEVVVPPRELFLPYVKR